MKINLNKICNSAGDNVSDCIVCPLYKKITAPGKLPCDDIPNKHFECSAPHITINELKKYVSNEIYNKTIEYWINLKLLGEI